MSRLPALTPLAFGRWQPVQRALMMLAYTLEFQPGAGAFDFWIDDLSFY